MKGFIYFLMIVTLGLVIYNLTKVNYSDPLNEKSIVALITVIAGCCAILLLAILRTSKRIEETVKKKK